MFDSHRNRALLKSNWIPFKLKLMSSKLNWTLYEQKSKLSIQKLNVTFLHLKSRKGAPSVWIFTNSNCFVYKNGFKPILKCRTKEHLSTLREEIAPFAYPAGAPGLSLYTQLFLLHSWLLRNTSQAESLVSMKWRSRRARRAQHSTISPRSKAKKIRAPLNFKKDSSASVGKRIKILRKFQHCLHCFFAGQLIVKFQ